MANLQVKSIDDELYESLGRKAVQENRSISQEVVHLLKRYLSEPQNNRSTASEAFLSLCGSWQGNESVSEFSWHFLIKDQRVGPAQVKWIAAEQIVLAPDWRHRQSSRDAATHMRLTDGSVIDDQFGAVFNRLRQIELPHFAAAAPADRDYALAEMQAPTGTFLAYATAPGAFRLLTSVVRLPPDNLSPKMNPAGPGAPSGNTSSLKS